MNEKNEDVVQQRGGDVTSPPLLFHCGIFLPADFPWFLEIIFDIHFLSHYGIRNQPRNIGHFSKSAFMPDGCAVLGRTCYQHAQAGNRSAAGKGSDLPAQASSL